jgi:phosphoglycerate dehydrogenase-like enzyme
LHLPLTPETEGLIDQRALARMKPAAVLINTARGGLVEEAALVEALTSGRLLAAGLDVLAEEPPPPDHPLLSLDNVVLTPHVAWLTQETLSRSFDVALENMSRGSCLGTLLLPSLAAPRPLPVWGRRGRTPRVAAK